MGMKPLRPCPECGGKQVRVYLRIGSRFEIDPGFHKCLECGGYECDFDNDPKYDKEDEPEIYECPDRSGDEIVLHINCPDCNGEGCDLEADADGSYTCGRCKGVGKVKR